MLIAKELKRLSLSLMVFFAFIVVVARVGFVMKVPINQFTLLFALLGFIASLFIILKKDAFITVFFFLLTISVFGVVAMAMSKTYDTSWDGQGYHQSAVIALAQGWNPIYEPDIHFVQRLPSQVFAESYPSALWEVQANIYAVTREINSAKVVNFAISIVALSTTYLLLRKMSLGKGLSGLLAILIVVQPLYVIQFLSFMQDGFGYELILIAITSLLYFIIQRNSNWALSMFILSEIFLASTKYSHLPMVLMLGLIFIAILGNRFLNKDYVVNSSLVAIITGLTLFSIVFAYLPYGRNIIFHHAAFYPTNIPELNGSVTYNNLPHNLENKFKITQLFYGAFSESQKYESSDNRSVENVATLKIPFTFTNRELTDAAKLYNNRAGAAGPLFSGILLATFILIIVMSFKAETRTEKYVFYGIYFCTVILIITSLLVPTPNLIRYTSQIQLLPFVLFIPVLAIFKSRPVRIVGLIVIILFVINNALYTSFVITKTIDEEIHINSQFEDMRSSGRTYQVKAQQFYSSYILLHEQNIRYVVVDDLPCKSVDRLYASSTTTQFCK